MDVVGVAAWVAALHCYGDSNDGDNNDADDDSNGGDRDDDNTHSCARGKQNGDAAAAAGEAACRTDGAAMADVEAAGQMLLWPAINPGT